MSISPHDLLHHIIDEINFLISESGILDKNSFLDDEKAKRAFARSFEIIKDYAGNLNEILEDEKMLRPAVLMHLVAISEQINKL